MSTDTWLELAVALAALGLLTLASLVEANLATVNRLTLRDLIEGRAGAHRVQSLIDRPRAIRASMVLLELASAATAVALLGRLFVREVPGFALPATLVVGGLALILAASVLPDVLTPEDRADEPQRLLRVARMLCLAATPLRFVAAIMARPLALVFRRPGPAGEQHTQLEADEAQPAGTTEEFGLQEDEQEMISGVLGLEGATTRDIMVPRIDVVAVPDDTPVDDAVELIRRGGHSRIPVYHESIDTVVGVLYAKDLLRFVGGATETTAISGLIRSAHFVPDSMHVDDLLRDLQTARVHLAIVVDEYGGTAGLVTIEDILEEIVGEIQDEYDRELPLVERLGPSEVIVDGLIPVDEVADLFETDFAEGETGTVGGFVQRRLGRIPEAGETVRADGLLIEVRSVEHHRIRKLRVERVADAALHVTGPAGAETA
ncbi:MAG TPA: hemolysin family protein [Thermomicrobiaceae bacterium]|nr:hemolysin family protein [Thermomicrobiaceae bacterium]